MSLTKNIMIENLVVTLRVMKSLTCLSLTKTGNEGVGVVNLHVMKLDIKNIALTFCILFMS